MTFNFDANTVDPVYGGSREVIAAGTYTAKVISAEIKATKAGTGKYVEVAFSVADGEHEGVELIARYNVENPNPKAQQIGLGQLSALSRSLCASAKDGKSAKKIMLIKNGDFTHWYGLAVDLNVSVVEGKPYPDSEGNIVKGAPQNEIKSVRPASAKTLATLMTTEETDSEMDEEDTEIKPNSKAKIKTSTPDW